VQEVGNALGVWESTSAGIGLMIPVRAERRGEAASLDALAVQFRISRADAAQLNGRNTADDRRIVGIGAGALGSQVILNCARAAFGRWTIVDRDRLLPHNVARHALGEFGVGHHKALVLASVANRLTDDEAAFEPVVADILAQGQDRALIEERITNADLVVDLAASVSVARHLAHTAPGTARRVSLFLNPTGSDLVMLAEDRERQVRLDMLEMQYYRSILREPRLRDHLRRAEREVRYGRSCRDVSLRLPQALVALHAAIGTRQLVSVADQDPAVIRIWQANEGSPDVSAIDVIVSPVIRRVLGAWTVLYDDQLLDNIQRLRAKRLPNETGGILVGSFDVERKIIYVVDTIPSPADSEERRTLYIRGSEGLQEHLALAREQTFEQLEYVGEWHSHPDGYDCLPSGDDLNVLSWLTAHMDADGVPGVMMIACEGNQLAILLSQVAAA
jgi:proteasome lid subunit RPN8/RPN11